MHEFKHTVYIATLFFLLRFPWITLLLMFIIYMLKVNS